MTNQHGHVNCLRHDEVTSRDIPNLSDRRSYARSRSSNIVARFVDFNKDTGDVHYSVTSQAKAGKSYTVTFRFKDWNPDMEHLDDEIQNAVKGNIEIDCTCPAFTYQGYKFLASVKGGSVDIERRPPNETNPDRHGYACKHILKAIDSFNQDFDKFRAEGKGMIKKHNLRVQHKYERRQTLESSSSYSLSEKLDMRFMTYCDEVLGIHLSSIQSSSVRLSIAKALHDYMEQLMKICDIGNTYDALKRVFATGNPKGFDEKNRDKYERLVNTLKHHFRSLSGGVFEVHEARGGSTGHFPTDIRIEFGLEDNGQNLWVNSLRIPFTLCFSSSGQFRLLSGRSLEDKISECVADEVSAISDDWDKTRRDIYSDVVEESGMKTRRNNRDYESAVSDVLRVIESDLRRFIDKVQIRFEAICKSEYHFKRVRAYVDVEDGFVSDEGSSSIYAVLYDKYDDTIAEVTYSFKDDGIFDDSDDFVGETYEDLIEDIASRFASEYDNAN